MTCFEQFLLMHILLIEIFYILLKKKNKKKLKIRAREMAQWFRALPAYPKDPVPT